MENIDLPEEVKQKRLRVEELRSRLAELYERKEYLINYEKEKLSSLYISLIGNLLYEIHKLEIEIKRLKRKGQLIQVSLNRREPLKLDLIELKLDEEFEVYAHLLNEQMADINHANEYLSSPFLSQEETEELKQLYYQLAKRLHPDLNPNLTQREKDLFVRAQAAYNTCNLQELRNILLMLDAKDTTPLSDLTIDSEIERLEKSVADVEGRIKTIQSSFPFTFSEKLQDPKWIEQEQKKNNERIEILSIALETWKYYISRLVSTNGEYDG